MAGNINSAYAWAISTCNDPSVGYSQAYRNQQTVNGITYYDCSSFIWYALKAGGFPVGDGWPFVTQNMGSVLISLGFKEVSNSGEYKPGDIGVNPESHTEMCYQGGNGKGIFMGAHTDSYPLDKQVSISDYERSFEKIYRFGDGASGGIGASAYVCAAMAGNFWQESGLNPGIWQNLQPADWTAQLAGFGLGQWTNTGGDPHGRLYKVHDWLQSNGYPDDSGDGQCQYIVVENVWYAGSEANKYATLQDFLKSSSTDLAELTHAWNTGWEGIHDESWDLRVEYANLALNAILTRGNDPTITKWITGNRYLSNEERENNAVMLYRWFSMGGGDTPGTSKKTKWIYYLKNPNRR